MRARVPILLGLTGVAVFLATAALGYWVSARILTPERLRSEAETLLARILRTDVSVGAVRPVLFDGIGIDGESVAAFSTSRGPGLSVERVSVRFRPLSLLLGSPRLSLLSLDGARLTIERGPDGRFRPEPFARFDPDPTDAVAEPEDRLKPLLGLEKLVRTLLGRRALTDRLEVQRGEVVFADASAGGAAAPEARFSLTDLRGELRRGRIRRNATLEARARFSGAAGTRGFVEWEGRRERGGSMQLAMGVTNLELAAVAPYLRDVQRGLRLSGLVSGAVVFDTKKPRRGRLEVDLVGHRFESAFPAGLTDFDPIRAERMELRGALEYDRQRILLRDARLASEDFSVGVSGRIGRPLAADSEAQLNIVLENVDVEEVRHAIGWLPEVEREEAAGVARALERGQLSLLRVGGEATLREWQGFLADRTRKAPRGWVVDAQVSDAVVRVGGEDRIERLSGRVWWSGDRLEIQGARAALNGEPLPRLDVTIDGVTSFFGVDPALRALRSGAPPLLGLRPFWQIFFESDTPEPPEMATTVQLDVEVLEHPMFLWPIRGLRAAIEPIENGVHILTHGGTWAGVPVRGDADWLFEPSESLRVNLTARPPASSARAGAEAGRAPTPDEPDAWARGSFAVGVVSEGRWRQRSARGTFVATGSEVTIPHAVIELLPSGRIDGTGTLDFSRSGSVPFDLDFALVNGDVATLVAAASMPEQVASGRAHAGGAFWGSLRPDAPFFGDVAGRMGIQALGGEIRRAVPAVIAIALASQAINPFAKRESFRYDRVETILAFTGGRMSTESLRIDGPDVRAFASGGIELASESNEVDVNVVLFLFRQLDSVLDKIPVVNLLLLGPDESLAAAYFHLTGPWADPVAKPIPLRSIASSMPGSAVLEGVQAFVRKGIEVIESMISGGASEEPALPSRPARPNGDS